MLTQDQLKEQVFYDENTGVFTRRKSLCGKVKVGDIAGTLANGRVVFHVLSKQYYAHRLAWLYVYGEWPKHEIDHINGNPSDNRICNLRDVTHSENLQNLKKARKDSFTGVMGVQRCYTCKSFRATITVGGEAKHLGTFQTMEEASKAYTEAKKIYHIQE